MVRAGWRFPLSARVVEQPDVGKHDGGKRAPEIWPSLSSGWVAGQPKVAVVSSSVMRPPTLTILLTARQVSGVRPAGRVCRDSISRPGQSDRGVPCAEVADVPQNVFFGRPICIRVRSESLCGPRIGDGYPPSWNRWSDRRAALSVQHGGGVGPFRDRGDRPVGVLGQDHRFRVVHDDQGRNDQKGMTG